MLMRAMVLGLVALAVLAAEVHPATGASRKDLEAVERLIDNRFQSTDELSTMKVLWRARGAYLEGFGAVFTVELNLAPMANISPFTRTYSEEQKRALNAQKKAKLEFLSRQAAGILVAAGAKLGAMPADEQVALVITLFHFQWEDLTDLPSQLVIQARRQSLLDRKAGKLSDAELRGQLEVKYF